MQKRFSEWLNLPRYAAYQSDGATGVVTAYASSSNVRSVSGDGSLEDRHGGSAPADQQARSEAETDSPSRTILLVEDNFLLALNVASVLGAAGYRVKGPIPSANQALAAARSERLDGAVLDLKIVGGSSVPTAQVLRERGVPFLFLTAYRPEEWLPKGFGPVTHLSKPVESGGLCAAVSRMLEGAGPA